MKALLFLISFFVVSAISAQTKIYLTNDGRVFTAAQIDSLIREKTERTTALGLDMHWDKQIVSEDRRNDTIFYKFVLSGKSNAELKSEFEGKTLPDISFKDIDGNKVSFAALKGHPIILNFWFATCAPCIKEMPGLNELKEKYKNTDIIFLAITNETGKDAIAFLRTHTFNFTVIPDAKNYVDPMIKNFPTTFFVGRDGIIKNTMVGSIVASSDASPGLDKITFERYLKNLLQ